MGYFAANAVPIGQNYTPQATLPTQGIYPKGYTKLDVFVIGTEAVFQIIEAGDPAAQGWQEDRSQEMFLGNGFNSVPFETPFVAIRFKVWGGTLLGSSGTLNLRLLG